MRFHKWVVQPYAREILDPGTDLWMHTSHEHVGRQMWKCTYCGAVCQTPNKPRTSRDHKRLRLEKNCDLQLIRVIHDL